MSLLAGLALSACATTYTADEYDSVHEMLLAATQERDESLMREEGLRNQVATLNAQYQRAISEGQSSPAEITRLQQELAAATSNLSAAEQARAEAAASARSHAAEAERLRQEMAGLDRTRTETTGQLSTLQAEVERLRAEGKNASLTADGNIEIILPSDVTFASGEATLTKKGQQSLRGLASTLNGEYSPYSVRVEGHTDSEPLKRTKPIWGDNRGLGSARALSVVRYMESEMQIQPERLASASRGEHDPVADNSSKSARAKNRRVNIVVVIPKDQALTMAK